MLTNLYFASGETVDPLAMFCALGEFGSYKD